MTDEFDPSYVDQPSAGDFVSVSEPFELFGKWLADAERLEVNDPNAMALASVDKEGMANVRMVLLKGFDEKGFVFYTNLESVKGDELLANPNAALCFHWKSLLRQVRARGLITRVSDSDADEYFKSRPRGSRIGAWASKQSRPMNSRMELEKSVAKWTVKLGVGAIERPPHWSGFLLTPLEIEFWHDRPFRLHDRLQFKRQSANDAFQRVQLYP